MFSLGHISRLTTRALVIPLLLQFQAGYAIAQYYYPKQDRPPDIDCPNVEYPTESRKNGEEGEAAVRFDIDAEGKAENVKVVRSTGYRRLDDEAVKTVRLCKFRIGPTKGLVQRFTWIRE
jgi:TonB family protein